MTPDKGANGGGGDSASPVSSTSTLHRSSRGTGDAEAGVGASDALSASFLSQLDPRMPTERYSFDDHHDYFDRREWEAAHARDQTSTLDGSTQLPQASPPVANELTASSASSSIPLTPNIADSVTVLSRPSIPAHVSGTSISRAVAARRTRANSADNSTPRGSLQDARYPTRPRQAHPGPSSPWVASVRQQRARRPQDLTLSRPSSSSSRHEEPIRWAQRSGLMFADPIAPGTTFPHPSMADTASTAADSKDGGAQENHVYPWDLPRPLRRSITVSEGQDPARLRRLSTKEPPHSLPQALPSEAESSHGDDNDEQQQDREPKTASAKLNALVSRIKLSSNYFALYKFADRFDVLLLVVGTIAAIGSGVPLPLIGILFGQLIDGFNNASCESGGQPTDTAAFLSSVNDKVIKIAIIAAVNFFLIWTYTTCWSNFGERIVRKMREQYLASVLRQDMAFFDTMKPGEVGTRLSADLLTVQNGTSEKMGIAISSLSYFVTSYIVSFIKLPVLAGQLVSLLPAFGIVSIIGSKAVAKAQKNTSTHLSHAASLAAEALNNLPVVQAFGSQKRLSNIYQSHLDLARKQGTRKALAAAAVLGTLFFVGYSANALAFFSGSNLIADSVGSASGGGTVGSVYTVIFLLLDASFIIGQIAPYLQTFSAASGAGQNLLGTINKVSAIDGTDTKHGLVPQPGDVDQVALALENVEFSYPARPDEKALDGCTFEVPAGKRVALVGLSGSGKSTVAALVQRFYDPTTAGSIKLNGRDVREYNVRWLRSQIGVVGQEPVLFDCSIIQSIAHGLVGSPAHFYLHDTLLKLSQVGQESEGTELTDMLTTQTQLEQFDEIKALCIQAAEMAGAHDFISDLPQGYDTQVGQAGAKISGGQKQRISIARAIVRQPKLLLLDEATAALDSASEKIVADALDAISSQSGTTTLAIAHRLATIRDYDNIVVMGEGKVLEQGTHKQLLARRSFYYKLAQAQDTGSKSDDRDDSDDADHQHADNKASASGVGTHDESSRKTRAAVDGEPRKQRMAYVKEDDEQDESVGDVNQTRGDSMSPPQSTTTTLLRAHSSSEHQSVQGDDDDVRIKGSSAKAPTKGQAAKDQEGQSSLDSQSSSARYPPRVIMKRLLWLVRREWLFMIVGLLTSTIMGGSYSGEAVLFGHVIDALNPQCQSVNEVRQAGRTFGLYFFILALIQFFAYSLNGLVWGLVAERLLFRLRRVSFETMMQRKLAWYEKNDKNPASMSASLSIDANNLGGVTGTVIGTIFCIFVNLLAGIIVSHAIAWRIAVVILALVPIILVAGYFRLKVLADFQKRHETAYVQSNALAIEAVQCIRTIAGLGREQDVISKFHLSLAKPYHDTARHFLVGNIFLALALSVSYFLYAFAYWWGSQNLAEGRYGQTAFFIVLPALLFSAQASGQLLAFAPDFSKAHVSAANFFRLLDEDRDPDKETSQCLDTKQYSDRDDVNNNNNEKMSAGAKKQIRPSALKRILGRERRSVTTTATRESNDVEKAVRSDAAASGNVETEGQADAQASRKHAMSVVFDNVSFTYPSRSEAAVQNLSLRIAPGTFAAFVGQSGSGKTTAMSLIENFYTPASGRVLVDGLQTDKTADAVLRQDVAIVPQEPVIFYGTVRFNILLGLRPEMHAALDTEVDLLAPYKEDLDWQSAVSQEEIEDTCRKAGIHDTIIGFKQGYETLITSSQLSGGQKQRLSIARALIRKPRLLLLDECTSALDSHSEQAFQSTLRTIRQEGNCTILAIAHRMRTIRDSDHIFLFHNGVLEAEGSYDSLRHSSDKFKAMVAYQSLN